MATSRVRLAKRPVPGPTDKEPTTHLSAYDKLLSTLEQGLEEETASVETESSQQEDSGSDAEPVVVEEPDQQEIAATAVDKVISLLSSSLSQYSTPSHNCESERRISNWVRVLSTCQINFRRESSHEYLCAENGSPTEIKSTAKVNLDFSHHVEEVGALRQSEDGWIALTLHLNEKLGSTSSGDYKVDNWQFTGARHVAEEMTELAESFKIIRQYCEAES